VAASAAEILRELSARSLPLFDQRRRLLDDAETLRARLLLTSSELQAAATVLVMLDLIREDEAEQFLVEHRRALEALGIHGRGVRAGELTLRPTSAHGFQAARRRPLESLSHRPQAVASPGATVSVTHYELLIEWLAVAPGGTRGRGTIAAAGGRRLPNEPVEVVIPCSDDRARTYQLRMAAGTPGVTTWPARWAGAPVVTATISVEPPLPPSAAWIELHPPTASPLRIDLHPPDALRSGRAQPAWATPAECSSTSSCPT